MLLPGHGSEQTPIDADRRRWLKSVESGVLRLRETCDRVFIIGLSTGALLGLQLHKIVDGLVLLAPGIVIANSRFKWVQWAKYIVDVIPEATRSRGGLTSEEGWKKLWHYSQRSTSALDQLRLLQSDIWDLAPDVECPIVVIQGLLDQTCDPEGARALFDELSSVDKRYVVLEKSGHCLTADVEFNEVVREISAFISRN